MTIRVMGRMYVEVSADTLVEAVEAYSNIYGGIPDEWEDMDGEKAGVIYGACEGCEAIIHDGDLEAYDAARMDLEDCYWLCGTCANAVREEYAKRATNENGPDEDTTPARA